jgi:integrase/recombinase XerD
MLTIYRRHRAKCKLKGRRAKCFCPIWVQGVLRGRPLRQSLDVTNWEAASKMARDMEISGNEVITMGTALDRWTSDCEARSLKPQSMRTYRQLERELRQVWGKLSITEVSVDDVRKHREQWKIAAASVVKRLELLRGFFLFCERSGWIQMNPAKPVRSPRIQMKPTLPFSDEEWKSILTGIDVYPDIHRQSPPIVQKKIRALILLMRYSGLRISDAVSMKRERINADGRLFLYTQKTGKPVSLKLSQDVLRAIDAADDGELFWNYRGTLKSRLTEWQERLKKIAAIAGIQGPGFAHRLRDSFSVDLLNHGTPIEMVAILLGNTTAVVQKHYAPFVESRQRAIDEAVAAIWQ